MLIISAVPIGGHHLADLLAGVAEAAVSLAITHTLARSALGDRPRIIPGRLRLAHST